MAESDNTPISAAPTKRFFVSMLTRDIALEDAVLDLLDNCIDGVVRSCEQIDGNDAPYKDFFANITMKPEGFMIEDNCGGISKEILKNAFRMGRPDDVENGGAATVGMYGIGMKRAIFKLGTASEVTSRTKDFAFLVRITPKWMTAEDDWSLPVLDLPADSTLHIGTKIEVSTLREDIAQRFDDTQDNFIDNFKKTVAAHYSLIISKGFTVRVNGVTVIGTPFTLLVDEAVGTSGLKPYVFKGRIDGVDVEIYAGLSRPLPTASEIEEEEDARASRDDAGWTIICNDRIVVHRDKTRLTGWGEAGVPAFHGQFMAFSGVVVMQSTDLWKLPLTTTKRGIDASTNLYSVVKDYMREATKAFTSFTNKWKRSPDERSALYKATPSMNLAALRVTTARYEMTASRKTENAAKFVPSLPVPKTDDSMVRISYSRPRDTFHKLALLLFEDANVEPKALGEATFDRALSQLTGAR